MGFDHIVGLGMHYRLGMVDIWISVESAFYIFSGVRHSLIALIKVSRFISKCIIAAQNDSQDVILLVLVLLFLADIHNAHTRANFENFLFGTELPSGMYLLKKRNMPYQFSDADALTHWHRSLSEQQEPHDWFWLLAACKKDVFPPRSRRSPGNHVTAGRSGSYKKKRKKNNFRERWVWKYVHLTPAYLSPVPFEQQKAKRQLCPFFPGVLIHSLCLKYRVRGAQRRWSGQRWVSRAVWVILYEFGWLCLGNKHLSCEHSFLFFLFTTHSHNEETSTWMGRWYIS